jgi:hypothetical protein
MTNNEKKLQEVKRRIKDAMTDAFDEETAIDSDGTDQAERQGLAHALEIIEDVYGGDDDDE